MTAGALAAKPLLFGLGLLAGGILLAGLLVSIASPASRLWPHGERDWTFWAGWTAWVLYVGSVISVAVLDWWRWYRPPTVLQALGLVLLLAGAVVSTWAVWHLGFRESSGLAGQLDTGGPYRYSRNPQYVGYVAMLVGWPILAGSWMAGVLALPGIAWFLLAPVAEEPWLRDQYGDAYETYRRAVPRFVGRPRRPSTLPDQSDPSEDRNHDR